MQSLIYKAYNPISNKVYIGQTIKSLLLRRQGHELAALKGSQTRFHRAIRKYGKKTFQWSIIDTCSSKEETDRNIK